MNVINTSQTKSVNVAVRSDISTSSTVNDSWFRFRSFPLYLYLLCLATSLLTTAWWGVELESSSVGGTPGIMVFLMGFMGLLTLNLAWYSFIFAIFILKYIKNDTLSNKRPQVMLLIAILGGVCWVFLGRLGLCLDNGCEDIVKIGPSAWIWLLSNLYVLILAHIYLRRKKYFEQASKVLSLWLITLVVATVLFVDQPALYVAYKNFNAFLNEKNPEVAKDLITKDELNMLFFYNQLHEERIDADKVKIMLDKGFVPYIEKVFESNNHQFYSLEDRFFIPSDKGALAMIVSRVDQVTKNRYLCLFFGNETKASIVLNNGADPNTLCVERVSGVKDSVGSLAAFSAIESNALHLLLAHGADPNYKDQYGKTLLKRLNDKLEEYNYVSTWEKTALKKSIATLKSFGAQSCVNEICDK